MQRSLSRLASVTASLLVLALGARATIVVDPAGGGDFTSLAEALQVAADGEQILVKAGTYLPSSIGSFSISGKGLSICAEAGALVRIAGLSVSAVPAGHWVIVRGLVLDPAVSGSTFFGEPGVEVQGPGAVWLEDCTLLGTNGSASGGFGFGLVGEAGAQVHDGGSLILERCTVIGGNGKDAVGGMFSGTPPSAGAPGVRVEHGRVALHDCTVTGGNGGASGPNQNIALSPDGGAGVMVDTDGFADIAGCTVTGGSNGSNPPDIDYDMSGMGVACTSIPGASVWIRDSEFHEGPVVGAGLPGFPISVPASLLTTFTAPSASVSITSPLREGQLGTLQIQAQQGDKVLLLVALGANFAPMKARQGVFLLDTSVLLLPVALGSISDPGGALALPFVTPNLNPVLKGLMVPLQLVVVHGGVTTIEGGTALGWLDSSL
jgi:hypothetical protein